jgi:hypothetical protein
MNITVVRFTVQDGPILVQYSSLLYDQIKCNHCGDIVHFISYTAYNKIKDRSGPLLTMVKNFRIQFVLDHQKKYLKKYFFENVIIIIIIITIQNRPVVHVATIKENVIT